ncbi:hypothetical protein SASPL_154404 [Salvia splendens]|uniref:Uncharacterized protein n=1 Tax=Salvia splendens TaxID=180675 RepID=A0A8X8W046_SALSN|nr:hypothetical protein SASPL_154404 [Salvia splendens]
MNSYSRPINSMAKTNDTTRRAATSPLEARVSLVLALAAQTSSLSQRLLMDLATETARYVFPSRRFESRNLEEELMSAYYSKFVIFKREFEHLVCFTIKCRAGSNKMCSLFAFCDHPLSLSLHFVPPGPNQSYFIAETTMPGKYGFDFAGASRSFNVLAEYLFGKNTKEKSMEMTTPVFTRQVRSEAEGEKMDMTTPVITRRMSFVMPSKYGSDLPLPKDSSVSIKEVPKRIVAVVAFSGFVTDDEVARRESRLWELLKKDHE